MLTREQLLANQADLENQLESSTRDCVALNGALQNVKYLIALYDEEPDMGPCQEPDIE